MIKNETTAEVVLRTLRGFPMIAWDAKSVLSFIASNEQKPQRFTTAKVRAALYILEEQGYVRVFDHDEARNYPTFMLKGKD